MIISDERNFLSSFTIGTNDVNSEKIREKKYTLGATESTGFDIPGRDISALIN